MKEHRMLSIMFRIAGIAILIIGATAVRTQAQVALGDTFYVSWQPKTPAHPWYGKGTNWCFTLNGVEGDTLRLQRGVKYTFINVNLTDIYHAYYYFTDPIGESRFMAGIVPGELVRPVDTAWFTPLKSPPINRAPDTLYYGTYYAQYCGGLVLIYDKLPSEVGEEVSPVGDVTSMHHTVVYPNPAAGKTTIRFDLPERSKVRLEVIDALGKVVASQAEIVEAGNGRVIHLLLGNIAPGFYFYRLNFIAEDQVQMIGGQLQIVQ